VLPSPPASGFRGAGRVARSLFSWLGIYPGIVPKARDNVCQAYCILHG